MYAHADKADTNHQDRAGKEDCLLAHEVDILHSLCLAIELLVAKSYCIQSVHQNSCDDQGGKHRKNNTKR